MPRFAFAAVEQPTSKANSYLLGDCETGEILFANKPYERIYPASTTKMMTALVLLEQVEDLDQKITVGKEVNGFSSEASLMGLKQGEVISYRDLLYGMMLVSGNDAANAVAVGVGGSISGFADLMNEKASKLGMEDSHFVNPHGLHKENHYTTAADLFKLAVACMENETFRKVVKTPTYTTAPTNKASKGHSLATTNRLISTKEANAKYNYPYAIGIKTGSTSAAQGCLVAAAEKDGRTLIAVLMGDSTYVNGLKYGSRWGDAKSFFEYGFSLTGVDLVDTFSKISLTHVFPGKDIPVELWAELPEKQIVWAQDVRAIALQSHENIVARLNIDSVLYYEDLKNDMRVGTVTYLYADEELLTANVFARIVEESVPAVTEPTEEDPVGINALYIFIVGGCLIFAMILVGHFIIGPRGRLYRKRRRYIRNVKTRSVRRRKYRY